MSRDIILVVVVLALIAFELWGLSVEKRWEKTMRLDASLPCRCGEHGACERHAPLYAEVGEYPQPNWVDYLLLQGEVERLRERMAHMVPRTDWEFQRRLAVTWEAEAKRLRGACPRSTNPKEDNNA